MPLEIIPDLSLEDGLLALEDFFEDDQMDCEYGPAHKRTGTECTVVVTHRVSDCTSSLNVCYSAVANIRARGRVAPCRKCGRPCSVCWTVRPI